MAATQQRDVIVTRYSEQGERELENLHTETVQLERAAEWSTGQGHRIVGTFSERDVSGRRPLAKRTGLKPALDMILNGEADNLVFAYFDRMVRKLKIQLEIIELVEGAGGDIYLVDFGKLTNGTAATKLSSNMLGAVHQYYGDIVSEKVKPAHIIAVKLGKYPIAKIPPGYVRDADSKLAVDQAVAPIVAEAFELRAEGATYEAVRTFLTDRGIGRTNSGAQSMLANRAYLGEVHFGELRNLHAHPAIIDRDLFERVRRLQTTGGRRAKSERLLSRLGVLRCGTCGGRMVISTTAGNYRCSASAVGGCARRVTVDVDRIERFVMAAVREYTADVHGRASLDSHRREAERTLADAEAKLSKAKRRALLADIEDDAEAVAVIAELAATVEDAQATVDRLGDGRRRKTITPDQIDRLPADRRLAEWRELIVNTIESVTVAPARSRHWDDGRITVDFLGQ